MIEKETLSRSGKQWVIRRSSFIFISSTLIILHTRDNVVVAVYHGATQKVMHSNIYDAVDKISTLYRRY